MTGTGNGRLPSGMIRGLGLGIIAAVVLTVPVSPAYSGLTRHIEPAQVLPLDQLPTEFRESVSEVIRDHTFHRQGESETFPCNAGLYLSLVNEPVLTLALWKDLAESPVQLKRLGINRYQGEDGAGTTATWDFVLRTPRLHVMLAYLNYSSPHSNMRIEARIVLIVRTGYFREVNNQSYIQHDVEAFVKVDSRGWKTLARTVRPMIERLLEEQVRELGQFVSLMSRLVVTHPNWAIQIAASQTQMDSTARSRFCEIITQNQKPGASTGRPTVIANAEADSGNTRRR